ncbi:RAMP superfamily CRISPR-associated protein [Tsukamurella hominis]|uniref:RAMP superfamily CRISPR-associated protein n=1 Tax=Tsukamurella hominis TaxID=1970232 RepID=UPI0039E88C14
MARKPTTPPVTDPPVLSTIVFDLQITAESSIVHRGDDFDYGSDTTTLFNRESMITSNGELQMIPVISGSSLRGVLRRISEEMTAEVLRYPGKLPTPAAHLVRNGGRLAKAATPLSDERERELRALIPHLALFGGAASARIMSGLLAVEKVLPEVAELEHVLTGRPVRQPLQPVDLFMTAEYSTHLADARTPSGPAVLTDEGSPQLRFGFEVMVAGTRLHSRIHLRHATPLQVAYFQSVLAEFAAHGHLGGRRSVGHGQITASITTTVRRGALPAPAESDWTAHLTSHRDAAIAALTALT